MATLPPSTDFTGSNVTEGGFKTAITSLRTFLSDLLGTDSADKAAARAALGALSGTMATSRLLGRTTASSGAVEEISVSGGLALGNGVLSAGQENLIINGDFRFWDYSTSVAGVTGYLAANRWRFDFGGSNATISRQEFTAGQTDVPGARYYMRVVQAANQTGNFRQKIEGLHQFNGATVSVSFYAKADSATTLPLFLQEEYASSGAVNLATQNASLTTSWQRFTFTFTCNNQGGNTFGVGNNLALIFNAIASRTVDIALVKLAIEPSASPFVQRPFHIERALCSRYHHRISENGGDTLVTVGWTPSTTAARGHIRAPVTMRIAPTLSVSAATHFSAQPGGVLAATAATTWGQATPDGATLELTVAGASAGQGAGIYIESGSSGYVALDAEL